MRKATEKDFPAIIEVWEDSVRATHDFLPENYLQHIKLLLPSIFPQVDLYLEHDDNGRLLGFMGIGKAKIEMLFIDPSVRGKGLGKAFIRLAVNELDASEVDVNEQNGQALEFYKHIGFKVVDRSETDGLGKPFPLVHLKWAGSVSF